MKVRYVFIFMAFLLLTSTALTQTTQVPSQRDDNIIIASYNIKWLGHIQHDFDKLAEVIKNFDVCGILEVKKETALVELVAALKAETNKDWGYTFGVRTHRPSGTYHEAYGAVWRRDRVKLGDGIISGIWDIEESFRNDPFIVSFKRENFDFSLILIHTRWTDDEEGSRDGEIAAIAERIHWMKGFLKERDLILAGDFNYPGDKEVMVNMAEYAELTQIDPNHKSTFKRNYSDYANSYDHIYISTTDTTEFIQGSCGTLDTTTLIYGDKTKDNMKKSKRELSDHLPVWAVFKVTMPDDD